MIRVVGVEYQKFDPQDLLKRLREACKEERRFIVSFIELLLEVDERRLDLLMGCTSMHDFCVRKLHMSGGVAYRRINAARLVGKFPFLLAKIASGALHLSGLVILRPYLTDEATARRLAEAASWCSESKIYELLAEQFPRDDVPERIAPFWGSSRTEPLSPSTYLVQLTITAATHEKLMQARNLLGHQFPDGNLAAVVDRALDELLKSRERRCRATARRKTAPPADPGRVTDAVRREVFARDGKRCTFTSASGERCPALALIEVDHASAYSLGGTGELENVRLLCRAHNRLHAEQTFGKGYIADKITERRAETEAAAEARRASDPENHERRAVEGLVRLGFAKQSCVRTVRSILGRGDPSLDLVALMQGAIEILAAGPRRARRRAEVSPPISEAG